MKAKEDENSLYTSYSSKVNRKITGSYYAISNEKTPLNINIEILGNTEELIRRNLPLASSISFDFGLIAGKSTNRFSGLKLFNNILTIINLFYPDSRIALKASPSSSQQVCSWMIDQASKNSHIAYFEGNTSIENSIVSGKYRCLISEMFTLSNLAILYSKQTSIISIEKTILKDFPSLKDSLTERTEHRSHQKIANDCFCLSEYISKLY